MTGFHGAIHVFCRVVDNFGDIGVCWRLARQLANGYGAAVTLWVDDLHSFGRICRALDPGAERQFQSGVEVRRWPERWPDEEPGATAGLVIEAFGCELPTGYIAAMAAREPRPAWINLEYLSAESWVEDCHGMPSHYPSLPLIKYFFFPGFTPATGGLILEHGLLAARDAFQRDPAASAAFLRRIGARGPREARRISLFCYPDAPAASLFDVMAGAVGLTICNVPQGVARPAVEAFLGQPAEPGACATRGSLTLQVLPFLDQADYDRLLWSCDINFVRGEDSMVRAQWAGRPFVWHIYPQQDAAHETKLEAFLDRYTAAMAPEAAQAVREAWLHWNRGGDMAAAWDRFCASLPAVQAHSPQWVAGLAANGDLAGNLLRFTENIG
ncbi:MAG: elongation factor P maturation arginine rhamnosyltransferase EarP [Noviherbaspirillum sp.]